MAEYIEREEAYPLAKKICDAIDSNEFQRLNFGRRILDLIDDIPAADVRPAVRGKWIETKTGFHCSACKTKAKGTKDGALLSNFCFFTIIAFPIVAVIVNAIKEGIGEFVILVAAMFVLLGLISLAAWCITT
jgi:hypothetical protein